MSRLVKAKAVFPLMMGAKDHLMVRYLFRHSGPTVDIQETSNLEKPMWRNH